MAVVGPLVKGIFIVPDGAPIPFLYNPVEIGEDYSANYAKGGGLGRSHPHSNYSGGSDQPLQFTMTVRDPWNWNGVSSRMPLEPYINYLYDLCLPIHRGGQMVSAPPTVTFIFGQLVRNVRIQSVRVRRTKWSQYLELQRAEIDITMFEVVNISKNRVNSIQTWSG